MEHNQAALSQVFHALADPTRRAVVQRLGQGESTVSDLAAPFDMALPSFMKHIGVLEMSGLIRSRKTGRVRTCELATEKLTAIENWFADQRAVWEARYANLDALLTELNGDSHDR